MTGVCIAAGMVCVVYYLAIIIYAGITADFAWIWLAAGVVFLGGGFLVRYGKSHPGFFPGWLKGTVIALFIAGAVIFLAICGKVIQGMTWKGSSDLDYVVVLGAQVRGNVPSKALNKRLKAALAYAEENQDTILILSGGKGSGEDITEAECMKEYLSAHGVPGDRMILEDKSTNTRENLAFSADLSPCAQSRTGIISNNFHVYRAVKLAHKLGYRNAEGIAAESDPLLQVHYVVREVFALVKEKLKGNI
ncbi:MAG: YdcF family protein [Eubacteriales bacterium]|nr:YdcF family protein [Eubacteriales bacterium]